MLNLMLNSIIWCNSIICYSTPLSGIELHYLVLNFIIWHGTLLSCSGHGDHPEWILMCDDCDAGWHASCLRPTLMVIPEGDWFCPDCSHR